jgi:ribosomal protein L7/L12
MTKCRSCQHEIPVGIYLCPNCGVPVDPHASQPSEDLKQQVRSLLEQGKKLEAVKLYKEQTGASLLEAKNAVEDLQSATAPPESASDLEAEILHLLEAGKKVEACKLYKDRMGVQLMEAKQAVESLAARHGIASQGGGGCAGVLLAIALVAAAASMIA